MGFVAGDTVRGQPRRRVLSGLDSRALVGRMFRRRSLFLETLFSGSAWPWLLPVASFVIDMVFWYTPSSVGIARYTTLFACNEAIAVVFLIVAVIASLQPGIWKVIAFTPSLLGWEVMFGLLMTTLVSVSVILLRSLTWTAALTPPAVIAYVLFQAMRWSLTGFLTTSIDAVTLPRRAKGIVLTYSCLYYTMAIVWVTMTAYTSSTRKFSRNIDGESSALRVYLSNLFGNDFAVYQCLISASLALTTRSWYRLVVKGLDVVVARFVVVATIVHLGPSTSLLGSEKVGATGPRDSVTGDNVLPHPPVRGGSALPSDEGDVSLVAVENLHPDGDMLWSSSTMLSCAVGVRNQTAVSIVAVASTAAPIVCWVAIACARTSWDHFSDDHPTSACAIMAAFAILPPLLSFGDVNIAMLRHIAAGAKFDTVFTVATLWFAMSLPPTLFSPSAVCMAFALTSTTVTAVMVTFLDTVCPGRLAWYKVGLRLMVALWFVSSVPALAAFVVNTNASVAAAAAADPAFVPHWDWKLFIATGAQLSMLMQALNHVKGAVWLFRCDSAASASAPLVAITLGGMWVTRPASVPVSADSNV